MQHHCNLGPIDGLKQTKNKLLIKGLFFASVFFTIISILYVSPVSALPTTADGLASPSDNQTTTTQKTIPNAAESAKDVNATVVITTSSDTISKTYGSLDLVLINTSDNSQVNTATTGTVVVGGYSSSSAQVKTPATFTDVEPGTYKVCLATQPDLCSGTFTKVDGQAATASQLVVPADKSAQVLEASTTAGDAASSCTINGIGWILCPVMTFMSQIVGSIYSVISDLLITPNLSMDTAASSNSAYPAWQIMRSIANVAFVIAFLVIIFSQLTNVGISNYGIKKMLPRLIIAAIFVNLSYFICAIAVDISNIVGSSVYHFFINVGSGIGTPPDFETMTKSALIGGTAVVGVGAAAAAVGAVSITPMAIVALVLPGLITAVFAILVVFLVLTLRQAIIILLIVISPLAFVAFILPNTEDWFEDWRELLVKMLLMYPIIAGIFGASALASKIVMAGSTDNAAVQIMGAFISVIPLAITPVVLTAAGGVLNKFGAMVNNPSKGPFDAMRRGAAALKDQENNKANNKAMNDASIRPNFRRSALQFKARQKGTDSFQKTEQALAEARYMASSVDHNTGGLRDRMTAGGGSGAQARAAAGAIGSLDKLTSAEIASQEVLQRSQSSPDKLFAATKANLVDALKNNDAVKANASFNILKNSGPGGMAVAHEALSETKQNASNIDTFNSIRNNTNGTSGVKGIDAGLATWAGTDKDMEYIDMDFSGIKSAAFDKLNSLQLAGQSMKDLELMKLTITQDRAQAILTNPNASQSLNPQTKAFFEEIAKSPTPPPYGPTPPTYGPPPPPSNP